MLSSNVRPALRCASLVALLTTGLACDRVERETVDRVTPHDATTWSSKSDCETLLAKNPPTSMTPRIGTWNIRYFPDAQEQTQTDESKNTDVPWLACAIASLDVDILAIQEIKTTERALEKQRELVQRLNDHTGGDWQIQVAPCQPAEVQHPGFLYDANRVTASNFREIAIMNPIPSCTNDASPGFGGYFSINGGPDFHLISVHMQSGNNADAIEGRDYTISQMQTVIDEAFAVVADTDIIFTGDFNTSGCTDCDKKTTSPEEVTQLADRVGALTTPFDLIGASESCSRHVDDSPPLLDHFVVAQSAQEVPADSVAHVSGICEETHCDRLSNWLEDALNTLSDHCPVLLDLAPADMD